MPKQKSVPDSSPRKIGYARVSTQEQNLDLQIEALLRAGVLRENIHTEKVSGAAKKRPGLQRAFKDCRPGDTFVVWRYDRFGRSTLEVLERIMALEKRDVGFVSLSEQVDTRSPIGKFIVTLYAGFAELERNMIRQRTLDGVKAAKARGIRFGAKPKLSPAQQREFKQDLKRLSTAAMAEKYDLTRMSVYNYRDRLSAARKLKQ